MPAIAAGRTVAAGSGAPAAFGVRFCSPPSPNTAARFLLLHTGPPGSRGTRPLPHYPHSAASHLLKLQETLPAHSLQRPPRDSYAILPHRTRSSLDHACTWSSSGFRIRRPVRTALGWLQSRTSTPPLVHNRSIPAIQDAPRLPAQHFRHARKHSPPSMRCCPALAAEPPPPLQDLPIPLPGQGHQHLPIHAAHAHPLPVIRARPEIPAVPICHSGTDPPPAPQGPSAAAAQNPTSRMPENRLSDPSASARPIHRSAWPTPPTVLPDGHGREQQIADGLGRSESLDHGSCRLPLQRRTAPAPAEPAVPERRRAPPDQG